MLPACPTELRLTLISTNGFVADAVAWHTRTLTLCAGAAYVGIGGTIEKNMDTSNKEMPRIYTALFNFWINALGINKFFITDLFSFRLIFTNPLFMAGYENMN